MLHSWRGVFGLAEDIRPLPYVRDGSACQSFKFASVAI
jgi:hypothetical protein